MKPQINAVQESIKIALDAADAATDVTAEYKRIKNEYIKTEKKMKANLNEVLSRIIPEVALMTGETDLLKALETIMANDEQRGAMNGFLELLYK